ncbi:MAG: hypothetical protein MJZ23_06445 [Paludibacteraceae bacterium]|nr:hypothetical protein [Paludibacteraceae bacterium]
MKRFLLSFIILLATVGNAVAADEIFLPSDDCFPDPVLDSLTIQNGKIYVEDHVITSGELSYVMHKVNPSLYEKRKDGQKIYLFSVAGAFLGTAAICTGNYWKDNFTGSRQEAGRAMFVAGIPVTAASVCMFTIGVSKAASAKKKFMHNCFGLAYVESVSFGVGANSLSLNVRW